MNTSVTLTSVSSAVTSSVARPRVLFIINSIGYGGAERALVNILSEPHYAERYDIHVVLLDAEPRVRSLPAHVQVHELNSQRRLVRSILNLRHLVMRLQPQICVSFLVRANVCNVLLSKWCGSFPAIICERMHLDSHLDSQFEGTKRKAAKWLPRKLYHHAACVLGVSTGVTWDLVTNFNVPQAKARTIFNPYNFDFIKQQAALPCETNLPDRFIVSVGRLTKSKNFHCLIDAYLASEETAALVILGTGELENELKDYIGQLGVEHRIHMLGYASNPFAVVGRAEYFVSASRNEGFPNAMLEAMVLGRPILMSDCPSGPAEILQEDVSFKATRLTEGRYGLLVPMDDRRELTRGINLLQNLGVRQRYSRLAQQRSLDFELSRVAGQYWDCIQTTLDAAANPRE
ncbi:glycosyltransferase [Alteromonas aestuariivivens]|uniref:Glycosyltransferase n=1 Tax=Alteromonas aestuariivivens TaxID=1938339 RepID=A0A3D8MD59_9ALTE|nr:glycosyltransferase [Alteromonas aestuariivivens]RDV28169.1 glycosyltransferase [Alteromonas aestuariivivens]